MGLSQAGITVDQQGVVILGGMFRDRLRRSIGQFVGRTDDEGLKGELVRSKAVVLLFRSATVESVQRVAVQNLNFKLGGEDVMQDSLDVFEEQGFNIALFKIVGAVKDERIALDVYSGELVEPGGNGGLREITFQLLQYVFPNISDRIQKETPLIRVKNTETAENPEWKNRTICRDFRFSA